MKASKKINWIARILGIIYILFISMFALDIFSEYDVWYEILLGLFMHLIPSFILIGLLILAWKNRLIGGVVYLVAMLLFVWWFNLYESWQGFLFIGLPLFVLGGLFTISGLIEKKHENINSNNKR